LRFLVMVKATRDAEAGVLPDEGMIAKVGAFNQRLVDAGMYLDSGGLRSSSEGIRISCAAEEQRVERGPFVPVQELVSGFWLVRADSMATLLDMFANCPFSNGERLEIREIRP